MPRIRQRFSNFVGIRDGVEGRPFPDEEEPVEYTPRLSAARRRAKRCGKVSELPAVGAAGEDAALLYDAVATAELDAARTPPSTDDDADALALMALSRS